MGNFTFKGLQVAGITRRRLCPIHDESMHALLGVAGSEYRGK